jgi:hypothetical protein
LVLARGEGQFHGSGDACNFFRMEVSSHPSDGGVDQRSDVSRSRDTIREGPDQSKPRPDVGRPDHCIAVCTGKCTGAADGCGGTCPPYPCTGCCDATYTCQPGDKDSACGSKGEVCQNCGRAVCAGTPAHCVD